MIVGIPKEIKTDEYRVSITPAGVHDLVTRGHKVLLEDHAGEGSGITNQDYLDQGAEIVSRQDIFAQSEMIIKVKEPCRRNMAYFVKDRFSTPTSISPRLLN